MVRSLQSSEHSSALFKGMSPESVTLKTSEGKKIIFRTFFSFFFFFLWLIYQQQQQQKGGGGGAGRKEEEKKGKRLIDFVLTLLTSAGRLYTFCERRHALVHILNNNNNRSIYKAQNLFRRDYSRPIDAHMRAHAHTHTHTRTHTHTHTHNTRTHARTHARTHERTHARTHARTHTHTHTRTYEHTDYTKFNSHYKRKQAET